MPGAPDPLYVAARHALLDALDALHDHLAAIVLVGAQAVYLHTGEGDLAVAPFTTDADLALDPRRLGREPRIERALAAAEFHQVDGQVGAWEVTMDVQGERHLMPVDLLVPDTLGGAGRRGARIPPHASGTARKAKGLEGALVDRDMTTIRALGAEDRDDHDHDDSRAFELAAAGPAALLVAKTFKIMDRTGSPDRLSDKDALDVYRLLRACSTEDLVRRFHVLLSDQLSRETAHDALVTFPILFGRADGDGCRMAVRAAGPLESGATLAASIAALTQDLMAGLDR